MRRKNTFAAVMLAVSLRRTLINHFDKQRNAGVSLIIQTHVHRIQSRFFKFELLDVDDEIAREKMCVVRQRHGHGQFNRLHDGTPVCIDEMQRQFTRAFVARHKRDAQCNTALRMDGRNLRCVNRVERTEEIQFPVVVGRCVAKHHHLNVHAQIKTGFQQLGTNFF